MRMWTMILPLVGVIALTQSGWAAAQDTPLINGWPTSSRAYDEALLQDLDQEMKNQTFKDINSVIVIYDGELLVERYFNGAERDDTHNPRSVGKTFAAAVLGIALERGYVNSLDQPLSEFVDLTAYEHFDSRKTRVTLRHLLTMTSGFEGFDFDPESPGNEENMYPTDNWVDWTLNLPMAREPGEGWAYFTAGIVVLGHVLNNELPGGLEAFADAALFEPLGIRNYQWQHTPQRVANTAGGVQLTPLGFAKFGQLYKGGGEWQGTRIMPESFARESLRKHETTDAGYGYGYLWWRQTFEVDDRKYPVAYCSGNGGNKIYVFDDQPLVIVVTASAYGRRYAHSQVDDMMRRYVIPAIQLGN